MGRLEFVSKGMQRCRSKVLTMALVLVHDIVDLGLDLLHHSGHDCCFVWVVWFEIQVEGVG